MKTGPTPWEGIDVDRLMAADAPRAVRSDLVGALEAVIWWTRSLVRLVDRDVFSEDKDRDQTLAAVRKLEHELLRVDTIAASGPDAMFEEPAVPVNYVVYRLFQAGQTLSELSRGVDELAVPLEAVGFRCDMVRDSVKSLLR